ncbi:hypothetical protein AB0912_20295 [Streptomyces sp. NPDC007084]|uniref:hypothetical protein n=1 Tax=Streptomyces sp. NPDC007084 TaxID=3154313 RepID=UPI00345286EC
MSHQPDQPQHPGWGGPQPPYGQPPFPPQPPKKSRRGRVVGFGCLGCAGVLVVIGVIAALVSSGSGKSGSSSSSSSASSEPSASRSGKSANDEGGRSSQSAGTQRKTDKKLVTFKVWGTAPSGALGPLDITYGSDSDNRKGTWKNGGFEATLPFADSALYYSVSAQLQGSGDIQCSVTVAGHTKKGHASGGYNICSAQLSSGLFGDWK